MTLYRALSMSFLAAVVSAAVTQRYFPSIKTVEVTKEVVHTDIQTVTHTVTLPNGAIDSTTTTIDHTQKTETDSKQTTVLNKTSKINISALVAKDFSKGETIPTYGISVSKEFIGPITIGAFGLLNGTIGLSVGLNF